MAKRKTPKTETVILDAPPSLPRADTFVKCAEICFDLAQAGLKFNFIHQKHSSEFQIYVDGFDYAAAQAARPDVFKKDKSKNLGETVSFH